MNNPTPALSTTVKDIVSIDKVYILYHRKGNDPRPAVLYFYFDGPFGEAINRGQDFCTKIGCRFVRVSKFLINLEDIEKRYAAGQDAF